MTLNEGQVTVTVDHIHKCDECTADTTCVSCIMAKAKAFELDESVIEGEEYKHNEESLECIMAKAIFTILILIAKCLLFWNT